MANDDELYQALFQSHFEDMKKIRNYVKWVKFRRAIHNMFYFQAHWVHSSTQQAHWVGR